MVITRCASSELQFGAFREAVARERQGALSRQKPGLTGGYAPAADFYSGFRSGKRENMSK